MQPRKDQTCLGSDLGSSLIVSRTTLLTLRPLLTTTAPYTNSLDPDETVSPGSKLFYTLTSFYHI